VSSLSPRQLDVLDRIEKRPELKQFFFKKARGLLWFDDLNARGYFNPENNPAPVSSGEEGYVNIPKWLVTDYLVSTSCELGNPENEDYAKKFLEILHSTTIYAREHGYGNHITWWQFAKIIRNIPHKLINTQDIDWIDYWFDDQYERGLVVNEIGEHWLPELLLNSLDHKEQIVLRLLDSLYQVVLNEKKYGEHVKKEAGFRYSAWNAMEITKKVARLSGSILGLPAVSFFGDRLLTVLDKLGNDKWSSIWRPAIEEHEQNHGTNDADDILLVAYRDCSLGFAEQQSTLACEYFQSVLENQYITPKRVVIHTVNNMCDRLRGLVDSLLSAEFFQSQFQHEQWNLLNKHYSDFNSSQKSKVLEIIENIQAIDKGKEVNEEATVYRRLIWLSPIKDFDDKVGELYAKYRSIIGVEPEHPDFSSYMTVGWAKPESPIPIENLLPLDVNELVEAINSFEDPGHLGEPELDGLIQCFKSVVKAKGKEFYPHLIDFMKLNLHFVDSLIGSYRDLWNEKKELPWDDIWPNLLAFCDKLSEREDVIEEDSDTKEAFYTIKSRSIISEIAQLIEDGTRSDDHAFDKRLIPQAYRTLEFLINHQKGDKFESGIDAVNVAINSPLGHCIEALINLTLRSCRLADKDRNGRHSKEWLVYESIYELGLKRSQDGEYEFITLIANYLPNFLYMSHDWTLANLSKIFDQSNYHKWLCAMHGYSYVSHLYHEVYDYLKEHGDLLKALDDENIGDHSIQESVLKNIVTFYVIGHENLTDPNNLISVIIKRKKYAEMRFMIWYVWTFHDQDIKNLQERVFELWPQVIDVIDVDSKEDRKLASQLCRWASFVDNINENTEKWLLQIAPYSEVDYNSHDLLKSLARISDSQPFEAQIIWLNMLVSYSSAYPPDAIKQILENLIKCGADGERMAVEIVDSYLRYGEEKPKIMFTEIKTAISSGK